MFRSKNGIRNGHAGRFRAYAGIAVAGMLVLLVTPPSYAQDSRVMTREVGEVSIVRVFQCDDVNTVSTHQSSRVNIKTSVQCGQKNGNVTYQEGVVNINRSVQCGPENDNSTQQVGGVNRNRVVQTHGNCRTPIARTQTADPHRRNATIPLQRERRGW